MELRIGQTRLTHSYAPDQTRRKNPEDEPNLDIQNLPDMKTSLKIFSDSSFSVQK